MSYHLCLYLHHCPLDNQDWYLDFGSGFEIFPGFGFHKNVKSLKLVKYVNCDSPAVKNNNNLWYYYLRAGVNSPSLTQIRAGSSQKVRLWWQRWWWKQRRWWRWCYRISRRKCVFTNFLSDEMLAVISGSFTGDKVVNISLHFISFFIR